MHKYALKLTKYSEAGALTSDISFIFCDTPQQLSDKKAQYEKMRYSTTDEDGNVKTGMRMYEVQPMQAEYINITDFAEFCEVNKVLK